MEAFTWIVESTAGSFESAERLGHVLIDSGRSDLLSDRVCDPWNANRFVALSRGGRNERSCSGPRSEELDKRELVRILLKWIKQREASQERLCTSSLFDIHQF